MSEESQCAIHCICFNAQQDCFALGVDNGVRIFSTEPLVEIRSLPCSLVGSVARCALLHRSNMVAIVSGGSRPKFADNTVMVWDDLRSQFILELTFSAPVQDVFLANNKLAVVLPRLVHVFSPFPSASPQRTASMAIRRGGGRCCALAPQPAADGRHLLVGPASRLGAVLVLDVSGTVGRGRVVSGGASRHGGGSSGGQPSSTTTVPALIEAHHSELAVVAISNDSMLLATGSQLGTVIRLWELRSRSLLRELRRGSDPVSLFCVRFSPDASFLAVSSDKSTVHIFAVRAPNAGRKTLLHAVGLAADEGRERSAAQFSLGVDNARGHIAFVPGAVVTLCHDGGTYHKFAMEPAAAAGGSPHCNRVGYDLLLQLSADAHFWNVEQ